MDEIHFVDSIIHSSEGDLLHRILTLPRLTIGFIHVNTTALFLSQLREYTAETMETPQQHIVEAFKSSVMKFQAQTKSNFGTEISSLDKLTTLCLQSLPNALNHIVRLSFMQNRFAAVDSWPPTLLRIAQREDLLGLFIVYCFFINMFIFLFI